MRRVLLVLIFAVSAFPCRAAEYNMGFIHPYFSGIHWEEEPDVGIMGGVGLRTMFFLKQVGLLGITIAPEFSIGYDTFNQIRIQSSALFGVLDASWPTFGYYAGASGIFMHDFERDINAVGIAPVLCFEFMFFFIITSRFQLQYEWYTDKRYNRFVASGLLGIRLWEK